MSRPYLTCREVIDFVLAYLGGELAEPSRAEFERHLAICPSCVNYLHTYRRTVELVHQAWSQDDEEEELPVELVEAVLAARRRLPPA
jgi:anti-sigma factor RsiW